MKALKRNINRYLLKRDKKSIFAYVYTLYYFMTLKEILDTLPKKLDVLGGVDMTGTFSKLFNEPAQVPGCLFLLCTRGVCKVSLHLTEYKMQKNSLIIIFPDLFFRIIEQTPNCRFVFLGFSSELIHSAGLFSYTIDFTPYIFEQPVQYLSSKASKFLEDYFMLSFRIKQVSKRLVNREQASLMFIQLILGLGKIMKKSRRDRKDFNRNQEIVRELIRLIITNYKKERNISFYAAQLHISPQHLSTTIKKITGKTLTDIISNFIMLDAKAKLCSTELTVQEIAYSLSFADISFFGKYFKRYTGVSPKQYRNMKRR